MSKSKSMDQVVTVPFRTISTVSTPSTTGTAIMEFDMTLANLGARAVAVGSTFEWFRFKKLRGYQYTNIMGPSIIYNQGAAVVQNKLPFFGTQALAFVDSNAALTGTATTITQMTQYERFQGGNLYAKLSVNVPKDVLQSVNYRWYSTASGGAPSDNLSPGLFIQYVDIQSGADTVFQGVAVLIVEGVLEFRGMITPALSFASVPTLPSSLKVGKEESEDKEIVHVTFRDTVRKLTGYSSQPK